MEKIKNVGKGRERIALCYCNCLQYLTKFCLNSFPMPSIKKYDDDQTSLITLKGK